MSNGDKCRVTPSGLADKPRLRSWNFDPASAASRSGPTGVATLATVRSVTAGPTPCDAS